MGFLVGRDLQMPGVDRLFWDNRDFYANPTRGFSLRGRCSRDFGWLDSSNSWTNVDAELDGCYHRMNTPPVVRSASCS